MDITVYLPDEIGQRAKEAELPFSRLLRAAVEEELHRRTVVKEELEQGSMTFEVDLEDNDGREYTGRLTGVILAEDNQVTAYLAEDERVLLYDAGKSTIREIQDPKEELRDWLGDDEYIEAMYTLGLRPVVDL